MPFLTETEPPRGVATQVLPGIRRIVADNPSVMTYFGTNTYLIDDADHGLTVLDPGPDDADHIRNIVAAAGATPILRIILTHGHSDHSGAAAALQTATGAPIHAHHNSAHRAKTSYFLLEDGDTVAGLRAVFTPGHAADHLCFACETKAGPSLFSGDHVMSWSSSIVNPPEGDMREYYRSLQLLLRRSDALYLPGHGPPLPAPQTLVQELLAHRQSREASIIARLGEHDWSVGDLAEALYAKTDPWLKIAAQRNVLAHFLKLRAEGSVMEQAEETEPLSPPANMDVIMRRDALRRFAICPAT